MGKKDYCLSEKQRELLKQSQLFLLTELISLCEKNNLRYYLVGGSALGAIRHKGYIPWDDDIDVALPRNDYNEFLNICTDQLPESIFLQTYVTDKDYRNDFAKLRLSGTTFIETSARNLNINHGVYIDVFPIDGYPAQKRDIKRLKLIKSVIKTYVAKDFYINERYTLRKRILSKGKTFVCSLLCGFQSTDKMLGKLEQYYQKWSYETSDEVVCHGGAWGELEHCPKTQYGSYSIASFENMNVRIPEQYDEYLRHKYGDYMQYPPEEKRYPHHYCDVIDLENSYEIYR